MGKGHKGSYLPIGPSRQPREAGQALHADYTLLAGARSAVGSVIADPIPQIPQLDVQTSRCVQQRVYQ